MCRNFFELNPTEQAIQFFSEGRIISRGDYAYNLEEHIHYLPSEKILVACIFNPDLPFEEAVFKRLERLPLISPMKLTKAIEFEIDCPAIKIVELISKN